MFDNEPFIIKNKVVGITFDGDCLSYDDIVNNFNDKMFSIFTVVFFLLLIISNSLIFLVLEFLPVIFFLLQYFLVNYF